MVYNKTKTTNVGKLKEGDYFNYATDSRTEPKGRVLDMWYIQGNGTFRPSQYKITYEMENGEQDFVHIPTNVTVQLFQKKRKYKKIKK